MELEKWGLKEGFCWDDDKTKAIECVFIDKDLMDKYSQFLCKTIDGVLLRFKNFSETDPNEEELIIGEFAYFWDEGWLEEFHVEYGKLEFINTKHPLPFKIKNWGDFRYCSHKNPLL